MMTRPPLSLRRTAAGLLLLVLLACLPLLGSGSTGGERRSPVASSAGESAGTGPEAIRTADPYARGYTDADFPRVNELAPGVFTYEQLRSAGEERFTTVSFFVVTDHGVLVADGQGNHEETARLVATIAEITDRPITHVVVSSDHGDHTGGNTAFPAGVEYIAHPTSAAALEAVAATRAEGGQAADGQPGEPDAPFPLATRLVDDALAMALGGRDIRILFLGRAHTGGDLVVHLPNERIVFMSEAYLHRVFPAMRSAFPSEWVSMLEEAQALNADVYVPGHGFVDSPEILTAELEIYRRAVVQVIEEVRRLHDQGLSLEDAQAAADFGELGGWSLSSSQSPVAVRQVYRELDGELPAG
jgi:glyoxylase-like metal-dependent hydrolase (beta-lactamase superfamily II)